MISLIVLQGMFLQLVFFRLGIEEKGFSYFTVGKHPQGKVFSTQASSTIGRFPISHNIFSEKKFVF